MVVENTSLTIGSIPIFLLLAVVIGCTLGPLWTRRLEGIPVRKSAPILVWGVVAVFVGGHLHYALNMGFERYEGLLHALNPMSGGMHAAGAILALVAAVVVGCRVHGLSVAKWADGMAPAIGLSMIFGRLACWFHGCCFGSAGDWPWSTRFPPGTSVYFFQLVHGLIPNGASESLPTHPLPLYFAAAAVVFTLVALLVHAYKQYDGQVALVALLWFGTSSAALEVFRADRTTRVYWGALPQLTWMALLVAALAGAALVVMGMRHARRRWSPTLAVR